MPKLITPENAQQVLRELGAMNILTVPVTWPVESMPDYHRYRPFTQGWATFAPWHKDRRIDKMRQILQDRGVMMLVDGDRAWTLLSAFRQTRVLPGEVWETGVYQGGSATLLKILVREAAEEGDSIATTLRLFDSFEGMPPVSSGKDLHQQGDFADTSLEAVMATVGREDWIDFRKGWIPASFAGLEDVQIRFAHVDVDLYQTILDCCAFIYPRLVPGGMMVFDDYGLASCPGARAAVDEFFRGRPETPFPLINGQCVVVRHACAVGERA